MRVSRQSNLPKTAKARDGGSVGRVCDPLLGRSQTCPTSRLRAFTLVELILVLVLLAITATLVGTNMGSFFRGRALNFEARRMLSLTHYAQSRAVSEGAPVILWINAAESSYGVSIQSSYSDAEADDRPVRYTADPNLQLETPAGNVETLSEEQDERLGLPDGMVAIRFMPDGFFDDSSVKKIIIRQGAADALALVPTANRLGYEIRPATNE
jgi:prepilin-type N-terminal cleavage/methylation domain-containing protein